MYQRLPDGGVHRMGVEETAGSEEAITRTWGKFHAIQMRTPVQLPMIIDGEISRRLVEVVGSTLKMPATVKT